LEHSIPNLRAETHEWTSSLQPDKYEVTLTDTHIAVSAKILTDVTVVAPKLVSFRVLTDIDILDWVLDQGQSCNRQWISFSSVTPTTPSPSAAILRIIVTRSRLLRFYRKVLERTSPTARCSTTANTKHVPAWTKTIFVSTEKK